MSCWMVIYMRHMGEIQRSVEISRDGVYQLNLLRGGNHCGLQRRQLRRLGRRGEHMRGIEIVNTRRVWWRTGGPSGGEKGQDEL